VVCIIFTAIAACYLSKKHDAIKSSSVHSEDCVPVGEGGVHIEQKSATEI
jgi:hypothetical protein